MTAILTSFIPDTFPEFFGDVKCQGNTYVKEEGKLVGCRLEFAASNYVHEHGPDIHWGARHFMWMWMSIILGFVQSIGIVTMTYNHLEKNESR